MYKLAVYLITSKDIWYEELLNTQTLVLFLLLI